jgi:hypothetical protein
MSLSSYGRWRRAEPMEERSVAGRPNVPVGLRNSPHRRTFVRYFDVVRAAAVLPGYASVGRASEVLHLAPRSVRDLIYAGRLPSLRVGRLHYIKAADLDLERRRRLGSPLPRRRSPSVPRAPRELRQPRPGGVADRMHADPALRRERAAQRAEIVARWAQRHRSESADPRLPFVVLGVAAPVMCAACGREVRRGRIVEFTPEAAHTGVRFCTTCSRRLMLEWADQRRREAAAARQLSQSLGRPVADAAAVSQPHSATLDAAAAAAAQPESPSLEPVPVPATPAQPDSTRSDRAAVTAAQPDSASRERVPATAARPGLSSQEPVPAAAV